MLGLLSAPFLLGGGGGSKRPAPLFPGPQGGPAHGLHPRFVVAEIWADKGGGGGGGGTASAWGVNVDVAGGGGVGGVALVGIKNFWAQAGTPEAGPAALCRTPKMWT